MICAPETGPVKTQFVRSSARPQEKRDKRAAPFAPRPASVSNQALQRHLQRGRRAPFTVSARNDASEHEASRAAASFAPGAGASDHRAVRTAPAGPAASPIANAIGDSGAPLEGSVRADMEAHFGVPLGDVRTHAGPRAGQLAASLGAQAFTHGRHIVFGPGRSPGSDALTAHEMAHVVQQGGGGGGGAGPSLTPRPESRLIQPSFAASYLVPSGVFEVDLATQNGAGATPPTKSGLSGTIRFIPSLSAPNSNVIAFHQIARVTSLLGADINPSSMGALQAPRGALGDPGLRTEDDPDRGVMGGFFTDVFHQPRAPAAGGAAPPAAAQGSDLSSRYPSTPGFKRSDDPADIRSTQMRDFPGTVGGNMDFALESVALGEDTMVTYGAVNWGFGLRAGAVVNEYLNVVAGQSATFDEAQERHRDFYVHEPVTFYFAFNSADLTPIEAAKIDTFTAYLARNPDIHMLVEGFADVVGGDSPYNRDLALRRAEAVKAALIARGFPEEAIGDPMPATAHIGGVISGHAASTDATRNAGTGDQGGDAARGADQTREANRWANRRVVLTFRRATAARP
jgi:outer membrane protein OmpA-like peptidoglycan-associated protein